MRLFHILGPDGDPVAEGCWFSTGRVAVQWYGLHHSWSMHESWEAACYVHVTLGGRTMRWEQLHAHP